MPQPPIFSLTTRVASVLRISDWRATTMSRYHNLVEAVARHAENTQHLLLRDGIGRQNCSFNYETTRLPLTCGVLGKHVLLLSTTSSANADTDASLAKCSRRSPSLPATVTSTKSKSSSTLSAHLPRITCPVGVLCRGVKASVRLSLDKATLRRFFESKTWLPCFFLHLFCTDISSVCSDKDPLPFLFCKSSFVLTGAAAYLPWTLFSTPTSATHLYPHVPEIYQLTSTPTNLTVARSQTPRN